MAQYKVGNRYLNDEEYDQHTFEIWGFWLFVLGAFMAGSLALEYLPAEWSKAIRSGAVLASGGLAGFILSSLALYIRLIVFIGLGLAGICGLLYWVWLSV